MLTCTSSPGKGGGGLFCRETAKKVVRTWKLQEARSHNQQRPLAVGKGEGAAVLVVSSFQDTFPHCTGCESEEIAAAAPLASVLNDAP